MAGERRSLEEDQGSGARPGAARAGELMSEVQRARMLGAAAEVVGEMGYSGMSVARVTARAGVSRRTFYEMFTDREDCFVAAFDDAVERASAAVTGAYEQKGSWSARLRAALVSLLVFLEEEPVTARLCVVEVLGAGPVALDRRAQALDSVIDAVDLGRREPQAGAELTRLTAEGVVGAAISILGSRIPRSDPSEEEQCSPSVPLVELANPLMQMIVLPYLGAPAARKELTRPVSVPRRGPRVRTRRIADPLGGLDMRLTYRTLRVLAVIADRPKISNREVAVEAEIADQGQVSKLLNRLEGLGLILNSGPGHSQGGSNAWRLTTRGKEIQETLGIKLEMALDVPAGRAEPRERGALSGGSPRRRASGGHTARHEPAF